MEQDINTLILEVEKAAAERNVQELEKLLHPEYRVVANRFKGVPGTTILTKTQYLALMKAGKVGGTPYGTEVKSVSITGHTAMVELLYRAEQGADMHKYLLLVQDETNQWKIVSDLPLVLEK